ncbi:MAG: hypothetical protein HY908_08390 [Myxococcales bacterium]|nr:hypothetical protein [Myxococcales bacterium]
MARRVGPLWLLGSLAATPTLHGCGFHGDCKEQDDVFLDVTVDTVGASLLTVRGACASAVDVQLPPPWGGYYPYNVQLPVAGETGDSCVVTLTFPDGKTLTETVTLVWIKGCDIVTPETDIHI